LSNEKKISIRKESRFEDKFIVRDPFEKRKKLMGLSDLNESIIKRKNS
jgi:hypothetical protein